MPMLKKFLLALLTAALLAACALLPSAVALWQDHRQLGRVETEAMEPIALGQSASSLLDRLRLCSQNELYCEVQTMSIGTGVRFQEDTAIEQARAQLDRLHEAGVLALDVDQYVGLGVAGVDFLADPGEPSNNAMVWRIAAHTMTGETELLLDDESGLIIALGASDMETPPAAGDPDASGTAWADYLGLSRVEVKNAEAQSKVKYVAQIEGERYGITEKDAADLLWSYGGVTLANEDDPEGYQVTYLFRSSADSLWIAVA